MTRFLLEQRAWSLVVTQKLSFSKILEVVSTVAVTEFASSSLLQNFT
jgi:hypothetical protein